jgi:hypothetical protein
MSNFLGAIQDIFTVGVDIGSANNETETVP